MLNLKIPPPVIMSVLLIILWFTKQNEGYRTDNQTLQMVGLVLFVLAVIIAVSALNAFRIHRTTINPHKIEGTSTLVTSGIFKISRNPMYLAMALVIFGAGIYIGAFVTGIVVTTLYVLYITLFQIKPEERMLRRKFGDDYKNYCNKVRRWI